MHAMIARARGQRQTRDDISLIFNAILRSRRVARVSPAQIRTLRNKRSLCAFRNPRSERAIWAGDLCIGSALQPNRYHLAHGNGGMRGGKPNR